MSLPSPEVPEVPPTNERREPVEPVERVERVERVEVVPVVPVSDPGNPAERYVAEQLAKARVSLRNTQITVLVLLLILGLYLGYMTMRVTSYAQPEAAAEVATGIISERVNDHATEMAEQFKARIPEVMSGLPDQMIKQMPTMREALVAQVESEMTKHCQSTSEELGKNFDEFLDAHKEQVKTVFEVGQDREAVRKLGPDIERELMAYLTTPPEGGGESVKTKIDKTLAMLKEARAKTERLANGQNLTPEERKTRRAIAIIARTVDKDLRGVNVQQAVLDHVTAPPTAPAEAEEAKPEASKPEEAKAPAGGTAGNAAAAGGEAKKAS